MSPKTSAAKQPVQICYELAAEEKNLQVEACDAHGRAAHENERTFQEEVNIGAGPRACRPKQVPTRDREKRNKK